MYPLWGKVGKASTNARGKMRVRAARQCLQASVRYRSCSLKKLYLLHPAYRTSVEGAYITLPDAFRVPLHPGKEPYMAETPTCPACGMPKSDWQANHGQGYIKDGHIYCCQGCAEGTGCTCR